jgi:hypothetical protein
MHIAKVFVILSGIFVTGEMAKAKSMQMMYHMCELSKTVRKMLLTKMIGWPPTGTRLS